jgi:hypothetical protein
MLLAALALPLIGAKGPDRLAAGFADPPASARMRCYWWWLNGNTDAATITHDLEQMKAKGYGGALLVDADGSGQQDNRMVPAGPMFGSPEWRALYRHALQEASRLGLELSLNVQSGWNLGGPMVTPERASKLLTWSRTTVHGPADFHQVLPQPAKRNGFYRDIAVLAYPLRHGSALPRRPISRLRMKTASIEAGFSVPLTTPLLDDVAAAPGEEDAHTGDVLEVTAKMAADGRLAWHVPEGDWEILRMGYTSSDARVSTSSGKWQGLAIDYMDRTAMEWFWGRVIQPLLDEAKPYGNTLHGLTEDSWELGGTNWTGRFREEFRRLRGYDLLPYLPVIAGRILNDRANSNRFLNDFRRTVGDLIISGHYKAFAELAARDGLEIHPESGGPHGAPIDALETLGVSTYPQTEFWARSPMHRTTDMDRFFVKEASSAAHIYGKTLVAAEGETNIGLQWEESPGGNLKPAFDQAVCEGLNRLIWHTFTSSPKSAGLPGQEYFAGTHLNPNSTWWNEAGAVVSYVNRSQFLLQQGKPVSDVLYYYGDHVPNFVQTKSFDPAKVLPGYDYDVTDEDALIHRATVRDGRIVLPDGVSYRLLVLPNRENISLTALRAVKKLVEEGAAVIGQKPRRTTGLVGGAEADREVDTLAEQLWGGSNPAIVAGETGRAALARLGVPPDFESGKGVLDYVHRRDGDSEIYFVRNTAAEAVRTEITLRVRGRAPELWHPDTGTIEPLAVYSLTEDGRTRMPLSLDPYGSVFVVFRNQAESHIVEVSGPAGDYDLHLAENRFVASAAGKYTLRTDSGKQLTAEVSSIPAPVNVSVPWSVEFTPGWGAPARVQFPRLQSWTESADAGVRYYSGRAKYTATLRLSAAQVSADRVLTLDLGDVREIAHVRLNGQDLGVLWKKPFAVAMGAAAHAGDNLLEIEVTNFWPNRIIGDQALPPDKRLTHTNITKFSADSPLRPSGLLGPVTLRTAVSVPLQ